VAIRVDQAWIEAVCARCDPVFAAADVGFIRQIQKSSEGAALLWEADPQLFAARYPDSGIIESYGRDQWATVPCIDYWVYLDDGSSHARLSVDGWPNPEPVLLTGDGAIDGLAIGTAMAQILRVPPPDA
jgi:hypothetical protein